jgi:phage repressor protein C with HTH and peptisase S24 domain
MPTINEVKDQLQNLTNTKISYTDIGNVLGTGRANISLRAKNDSQISVNELRKLEEAYNVDLIKQRLNNLSDSLGLAKIETNTVKIPYRPDVYLSAGYGLEVYSESAEFVTLDLRLFTTDRGNKIKPENCEIVSISGNSMEPEYRHGDRVIIDRGDTEVTDGQIYAFRYKDNVFVKEINVLNDKLKCISLNKEYDPFYIKQGEEFIVYGRILPRIRL